MDVDRNTKLDVVEDILTLLEACVVPLVIIILYKYIPTYLSYKIYMIHFLMQWVFFVSYRFVENAC